MDFDEEYENDDREIPAGDTYMENFAVGAFIIMFIGMPLLALVLELIGIQ